MAPRTTEAIEPGRRIDRNGETALEWSVGLGPAVSVCACRTLSDSLLYLEKKEVIAERGEVTSLNVFFVVE